MGLVQCVTLSDGSSAGAAGTLTGMIYRALAASIFRTGSRTAAALALLLAAPAARAQEVRDLDPHVHAEASATPPRIRLAWPAMANSQSFTVRRRAEGETGWTVLGAPLDGTATAFDDDAVEPGRTYEYAVRRQPAAGQTIAMGTGYVLAGIDVPFRDDPGVVLLVIDRAMAPALASELDRFEADLAADGWDVARELVDATSTPPDVRARIQAAAATHGARLRAAVLLGAVPRAFSGLIRPDGHPDHLGAWPADGYYADLDGTWTDSTVNGGVGSFANKPGDGKFDQSQLPSDLDFALGRVDTADMPVFTGLDATALLRRYLDRNHAYRTGEARVRARGWVSDKFGYAKGEAFTRIAWRDSAAIFGTEPDTGRPFFDALEDPAGGYAFAIGAGGGNPRGAEGVGSSSDFVSRRPRAVFVGLFGSYFGDWSYRDNFLRASILGPTGALATSWIARPSGHYHALGALRSLGEAFLATANNDSRSYDVGYSARGVHQALLGDPTLRMFVVRPPSALAATPGAGGVALRWMPSPDEVAGYHVYRRAMAGAAPATRLTASPVTATEFTDAAAMPGARYRYRVVAVQRLVTGSGRFDNHSQGVFADATGAETSPPDAGAVREDGGLGPDGGLAVDAGGTRGDGGFGTDGGAAAGFGCRAAGSARTGSPAPALGLVALGLALAARRRARRAAR